MTKNLKIQIMWASVVLIAVLMLGFLGVYALQKSMTIKMEFNVNPNIRCQIEMKKTGEEVYTPIFSNVSGHEYIAPNMSLNNGTGTLEINQNFSGGIGSSFMLKYINYTESVILAQVSGIGAMENAVICSAYNNATPSQSTQEFEVASITGNVNLTFSFAEAITVQKVVTNCTITGETISYKNYQYIATINETTYLRDTILIEIGTEDYIVTTGVANQGITYNKLTGGIYIPASLVDDNIVITVNRGYLVTFNSNGGNESAITRYVIPGTTYGSYFNGGVLPTVTKSGGISFNSWQGCNLLNLDNIDSFKAITRQGYYLTATFSAYDYSFTLNNNFIRKPSQKYDIYINVIENTFNNVFSLKADSARNWFYLNHYTSISTIMVNSKSTGKYNATMESVSNLSTYTNYGFCWFWTEVNGMVANQYIKFSMMVVENNGATTTPIPTDYEPYIGDITATDEIELEQDHNLVAKW